MSNFTNGFELETSTGEMLPFKGVHVNASLFGLLAIVELTQQWSNTSGEAIEALYTFPLAANAQLIDLTMTIGERSLTGQVQPKSNATAQYEEAISEGQRAALVKDVGTDFKQISLGNIQPGDNVSITLRWVEPLRWSDKSLRWRLPTVIAPRYGDPKVAGLRNDQTPHTDLLASYNLTLEVSLEGALARTRISCPTHHVAVSKTDNQLLLQLASDARLDRDFILNLQADSPQGAELWSFKDEQGASALLSFQPPMISTPVQSSQSLVVLVDCSGSMAGDSIKQAREGLKAYLGMARPQDRLSIIRFGSSVSHCTPQPVQLDDKGRALLARKIDREIEADLGGTEIIEALQEAIRVAGANGQILLITDGEAYTSAEDVAAIIEGRCRFFPVGVGSSVSEQFLRDIADGTGGYCELVTPNENMAQVISAQCRRLTLSPVTAEISWHQQVPNWVESTPDKMFVGDSILLAANGRELAIASLILRSEGNHQQISVERRELDSQLGQVLRRYCSARLLPTLGQEEATSLAVREGLLCKYTAMIAIDEEKHATDGLPKLVDVAQMMAAGSHGYGCAGMPDWHGVVIKTCSSSMSSCERFDDVSYNLDFECSIEPNTQDLDLVEQLIDLREHLLNGSEVEVALCERWREIVGRWMEVGDNFNLDDYEMIACFIVAALPLVRYQLEAELSQFLRREAMSSLPAGIDLTGLTKALSDAVVSI